MEHRTMERTTRYKEIIKKSVSHIFTTMLQSQSCDQIDLLLDEDIYSIVITCKGSLQGDFHFTYCKKTIANIVSYFNQKNYDKHNESDLKDIAGEISNLIAGTFVTRLRFNKNDIKISHPQHDKTFQENRRTYKDFNLSYSSDYGDMGISFSFKDLQML